MRRSAIAMDEKTGLPVYSLYGEHRKPTAEQLKDIDALVYDIQDVGCRFYTYTFTMGLTSRRQVIRERNISFWTGRIR